MNKNKEKRIPIYYTIEKERIVGRSKSGAPIKALQIRDRKGAKVPVFHIIIGKATEIFYDIAEASAF